MELLKEEAELKAKNISTQLEIEQAQKEAEIQRLKNINQTGIGGCKEFNVKLKELNNKK